MIAALFTVLDDQTLSDLFLGLAMYAVLCRLWWWSLMDWREFNRARETQGLGLRGPRNPFPVFEVKPWG